MLLHFGHAANSTCQKKGVLIQKSARGTGPCDEALGELGLGSMAELVVDVGVGSRHTGIVILVIRYDSGVSEREETEMAGENNYNMMMMDCVSSKLSRCALRWYSQMSCFIRVACASHP